MIWNEHLRQKGQHAFLGASKYHWINYDPDKIGIAYRNFLASAKGTALHDFAATCIRLQQKLPRNKKTLNSYVNDAIGFRMTPEQVLYYSDNCFGTADAICFNDSVLRVHDLKTGAVPAHMEQLLVYNALFCLEYKVKPTDIFIEDRIYQNDDIIVATPTPEDVQTIMNKIVEFDRIIDGIKREVAV